MGTPDFAEESLKKLVEAGYEICGVVTNPDRPSGRGMKMVYSPVKEYALSQGLDVYQPEKITNNNEFKDMIRSLNKISKYDKNIEIYPGHGLKTSLKKEFDLIKKMC